MATEKYDAAHHELSHVEHDKDHLATTAEAVEEDVKVEAGLDGEGTVLTAKQQQRARRKVDLRVSGVLGTMYLISLCDRNNLGSIYTAGMAFDLRLTGTQYSLLVLMVFPLYILAQPVTGLLLRKLGPQIFFAGATVLWGIVEIVSGFVRHWYDLLPLRILLGFFEAGTFPGATYQLSCWYPRYDLQKRIAAFYLIGTIATAFTGIVSYGLSKMEGLGSGPTWWAARIGPTALNPDIEPGWATGIAGWRWIFIMFGIITCAVGVAAFFLVVDFPDKAHKKSRWTLPFLNDAEVKYMLTEVDRDRADTQVTKFNIREYLHNMTYINVWIHAATFGLTTTTNYALAYFLPVILRSGMGFSLAAALCLTCPPYILAGINMMFCGWLSDKYRIRSPIIIVNCALSFIGLALMAFTTSIAVRFFGCFVVCACGQANVPATLTWGSNNVRGQWKRALTSGLTIGAGGLGGIVGALIFRTQDAPYYIPGVGACMGVNGLNIMLCLILVFKYSRTNKRAEQNEEPLEGLVGFRYTL